MKKSVALLAVYAVVFQSQMLLAQSVVLVRTSPGTWVEKALPGCPSGPVTSDPVAGNLGCGVYPSGGSGGGASECTVNLAPGSFPSTLAGPNTYCTLRGQNYPICSVTLSGPNIHITGGGVLQHACPVDLFVTVAGVDDFVIDDMFVDGNNISNGYIVKGSGGNRTQIRNVSALRWVSNGGNNFIRFNQGTGNRLINFNMLDYPAENNVAFTSDTGDQSDFMAIGNHFQYSGNMTGLTVMCSGGHFLQSGQVIGNTAAGVGRGFYSLLQSCRPRNVNWVGFDTQVTGNQTTEANGVWGCDGGSFSGITGSDNNFGMANQPFNTYHDSDNCHFSGYVTKLLNPGSQFCQMLDSHDSTFSHFRFYGGGGNLNNTPNRGACEGGVGATFGENIANNTWDDIGITMPTASTNYAFRYATGYVGDSANGLRLSNFHIKGSASAKLIALASVSGATFDRPIIDGSTLDTGTVAIEIGSNVTNARVGANVYTSIATLWSFASPVQLVDPTPIPFSSIPTNLANGSQLFVTDGKVTSSSNNACASGGSGAALFRLNNANKCIS